MATGQYHPGAKGFQGSKDAYDLDHDAHEQAIILLRKEIGNLKRAIGPAQVHPLQSIINVINPPASAPPATTGAGLPTFQTFTATGAANPSFTLAGILSTDPISNGPRLIVIYQGQVQNLTDQYSIAGSVVTLTFTPANGEKVLMIYWT